MPGSVGGRAVDVGVAHPETVCLTGYVAAFGIGPAGTSPPMALLGRGDGDSRHCFWGSLYAVQHNKWYSEEGPNHPIWEEWTPTARLAILTISSCPAASPD